LRNAARRGRCDEAYVDRSLARLGRLPITIDDQTDNHAWGATRTLSRDHSLTLYDAAYLELAIRAHRPLASCDADLIAAATHRRIETFTA
jgi:predicted nucleic acid-binding protein